MTDRGPRSYRIERSVLGAPFAVDGDERPEVVARLVEGAEPEYFAKGRHRRLFSAICDLHARGESVDMTLLAEELGEAGDLDAVGGLSFLATLVDESPTAGNLSHHLDRLREYRTLRRVRSASETIADAVENASPSEAGDLVESALEAIRNIQQEAAEASSDGLRTAQEILDDPETGRTPVTVANKIAWQGLTTLLAGREKSGKSTLVRYVASRRTGGRPLWEGPPQGDKIRVLYWGQERPGDIAADLQRLGADLDRVYPRDMRLIRSGRFAALRGDLTRVEPKLLVIDTLSTFVDRMDLDPGSSSDWEPVMNRFGALAQEDEIGIVLNHHARKSDGEYRDSTAIGAGVDAILELRRDPEEGENVRRVKVRSRSAVSADSFSYLLDNPGKEQPRLRLLNGSLSLEERVQRYVLRHEGCSQRAVIDGVRGKGADVRDALKELCEEEGPLEEDDSTTPYQYRVRQDAGGNGTEAVQKRLGNGSADSGGESVSESAPPSAGGGRSETPAGSADSDERSEQEGDGTLTRGDEKVI